MDGTHGRGGCLAHSFPVLNAATRDQVAMQYPEQARDEVAGAVKQALPGQPRWAGWRLPSRRGGYSLRRQAGVVPRRGGVSRWVIEERSETMPAKSTTTQLAPLKLLRRYLLVCAST